MNNSDGLMMSAVNVSRMALQNGGELIGLCYSL